ncbi:MAG TPA: M18 family aminopeptidase [Gammaproteobacteria bacterium]|nr:M18 family aminopeptidase [Pseudomonadota bacterium]HAY47208.1 M18 family aminopeptidase [Gammaproteobacteria bacterium]
MINDLLLFLDDSPTPFHATNNLVAQLESAGFTRWEGELDNGQYYETRNDSSLIAWQGAETANSQGFKMVGAHTDSPCLKLKPNAIVKKNGYLQCGVEVYGGVLQHSWFDRDLALAGRVSGIDKNGNIASELMNVRQSLGIIPSLAIHLNRDANKNNSVNPQEHLPVLISSNDSQNTVAEVLLQYSKTKLAKITDFELSFYDHQGASILGLNQEFIVSARLDNLLSCYLGCTALTASPNTSPALLVCTDHEEVGSASTSGAAGPFLASILRSLAGDQNNSDQVLQNSILVSADNAHALHPNYADKHDDKHGPKLNGGPVIKVNANQRYATNSETSAAFKSACSKAEVPVQTFVTRSDMSCGSTIGPITATELGVPTVDVGVPQFAMHSIRETAGVTDCEYMLKALIAFYDS